MDLPISSLSLIFQKYLYEVLNQKPFLSPIISNLTNDFDKSLFISLDI